MQSMTTEAPIVPHSFPIHVDLSSMLMDHPEMARLMAASKLGDLNKAVKALQSIIASAAKEPPASSNNHNDQHHNFNKRREKEKDEDEDEILTPEKLLELLKVGYRTTESEFVKMVQILFSPDRDKRTAIYYASTGNHHSMVWTYLSLLILSGLLVASRRSKEKMFSSDKSDTRGNKKQPSASTDSSQVIQYTIPGWLNYLKYFKGVPKSKKKKYVDKVFTAWGITNPDSTAGAVGGTDAVVSTTSANLTNNTKSISTTSTALPCFLTNKVTLHCLILSIMHSNNPFSIFLSKMNNIACRKISFCKMDNIQRTQAGRNHSKRSRRALMIDKIRAAMDVSEQKHNKAICNENNVEKETKEDNASISLIPSNFDDGENDEGSISLSIVLCTDTDDVVVIVDDDDDSSDFSSDYVMATRDEKENMGEEYVIDEDWVQVMNDASV